MSLPRREPTQEQRIQINLLAAQCDPTKSLLLEASRLLTKLEPLLLNEREDSPASIEAYTLRLKIDRHLGILWDWREDIGVPRPGEGVA